MNENINDPVDRLSIQVCVCASKNDRMLLLKLFIIINVFEKKTLGQQHSHEFKIQHVFSPRLTCSYVPIIGENAQLKNATFIRHHSAVVIIRIGVVGAKRVMDYRSK